MERRPVPATVLTTDPLRVKVPSFDGGLGAHAAFGPSWLPVGADVRVQRDSQEAFVVVSFIDPPPSAG